MELNKEQLERILGTLASKKSRTRFFQELTKTHALCYDLAYDSIPEKYIDELLDIDIPKEDVTDTCLHLATIAQKHSRYEKAAHLYKELGALAAAIGCARKAGLDKLVDEWADEYIQAAYQEAPKNSSTDKIDNRVIEAARRAKELGLKERAQHIVAQHIVGMHVTQCIHLESDPEGHEARGAFAKEYGLTDAAEKSYRKAMTQFEEEGDYDSALRVARTLDNSEKIGLYASLRFLVATSERKAQIEQDRADDADGKEFEREQE